LSKSATKQRPRRRSRSEWVFYRAPYNYFPDKQSIALRHYGTSPAQKAPALTDDIRMMVDGTALFRAINRHGQVQAGRLSGIDVARVVKKLTLRAGLDGTAYAGHSLRAGHATSAAIAGASERSIMNQTGHRRVQMVRRYIRDGSLFRENSGGKLGL
jgi:hypothetical protein